ncbi:unnamed protein product, partial [Rotaria sp. Silwood1]
KVVHFGVGYIHTDSTDIDHERKKIRQRYLSSISMSTESPNNIDIRPSR